MDADRPNRDEAHEAPPTGRSGASRARSIYDLIDYRLNRRAALKGLAAATFTASMGCSLGSLAAGENAGAGGSSLGFEEIEHAYGPMPQVASGYRAQVLIRWGDPVAAGAPAFDVNGQSAERQEQQFGYNNDFLAYLPLPRGSQNSEHGLLCVNFEYTDAELMFPGLTTENRLEKLTPEQLEIEMAAHGHGVVEIRRRGDQWEVVPDSAYNRRLSARSTPIRISGPAAGHERLKTSADPEGTRVIGTLNNCAGGVTPWGTVLVAEENFHQYFTGEAGSSPEAANHRRYGVGAGGYAWHRIDPRFRVEKEPHEANRFGWIVEFDPYDPKSEPVKRTALGRLKHEGSTTAVNRDGRVVVYSGDDERFEFLYKFVSRGRYNPDDPGANRDLLDEGTLYVARFDKDGTVRWLPLVYGEGPLTSSNGFASQADVLIETRRAATLVGATPMDRPEDVEPNPVTGRVYVILTNNTKRREVNAANPRPTNVHGHVIELAPPRDGDRTDHAALEHGWEIFLLAGDPDDPEDGARYHEGVSENGWLSCPDNCAFDNQGRLWISTDGAPGTGRFADGVYACDTTGPGRALTRHFFRGPRGAEICGPTFTPDGGTLFVSVQHPAEENGSTFDKPSTRWPDFRDELPPRPSVVAITREGGGTVGE